MTDVADARRGPLLAGAAGVDFAAHVRLNGALQIPARRRAERETVIRAIADAGLTGRGGGGFPTARKLALYAAAHAPVLVVNATEGEPASQKDRVLLRRAPHLVLDGAEVAAALIGAHRVVVALEAGRESLAAVVADALRQRARTAANVTFTIVETPRGYVVGEESALANYLVTGVARPFFRPVKSVPLRRRRETLLVQNAETLAHVALVARRGASGYRGDNEDLGPTALVTLSGAVAHPGVVEVALTTPLDEIVARGAPKRSPIAVLVGGYGGTWVSREKMRAGFDPSALRRIGARPGAGVLVVLDEDGCGITETARIATYLAGESAGQCGPCVFGLPAIADDCTKLAAGRLDDDGLRRLEARLAVVTGRGACAHPDGAARLVASALSVFADDVARHLRGHPCAGASRPSVLRFPDERLARPLVESVRGTRLAETTAMGRRP